MSKNSRSSFSRRALTWSASIGDLRASVPTFGVALSALTLGIALAPSHIQAATYYWDPQKGSGLGGTGTWDTTTASWSTTNAATTSTVVYTNNAADIAHFSTTAGTVTIAAGVAINANAVFFDLTAGGGTGYTIAGGTGSTLTFSGTTPSITSNSGTVETISAAINGTAGLTITNSDTSGFTDTAGTAKGYQVRLTGSLSGLSGTVNVGNGNTTTGGGYVLLGAGNVDSTTSAGQTWNIAANGLLTSNNNGTGATYALGALSGSGILRSGASPSGVRAGTDTFQIGALNTNSTFSGTLVGGGTSVSALTKVGTGTLMLTGSNTYTGATTVNAGTLEIGTNGGLYTLGTTAGIINVNSGGTLKFSRNDSLGGSSTATIPVVVTVNGGTLNSGGFYTSLTNAVFNGATIIDNGGGASADYAAFRLGNTVTIGGTTATTISIGTAGTYNGINLGRTGAGDATTFNVADATGDATSDLNVNDIVRGTGGQASPLIKVGLGTMTLSKANTYTGSTTVNAGTLAITGSVASPALVLGGGTLSYAPATASSIQGFANGTTLNAGGSAVTATTGNTLNLGAITHNAGGLVNFGTTGTITTTTAATNGILGPYASTGTGTGLRYATAGTITAYTGGTAAATAAGVTDTTGAVNYDVAAGGTVGAGTSANTLRYTGGTDTITGPVTLNGLMNAGTGTLTVGGAVTAGTTNELDVFSNGQNITINGAIGNGAAASALAYSGPSATLTLTGTNTYTGNTTIASGSLVIGSAGTLNNGAYAGLITNNGAFTYNSTAAQALSGVMSGSGSLTQSGSGTLTLTANNTFTGTTTVSGGTLIISAGGGLYGVGTAAGAITVGSGGTLQFSRNDSLGASNVNSPVTVTVNGGTLASSNSYTSLTNPIFNGATITDNGGSAANFNAFRLTGTVTVGGTATTNINLGTGTNHGINLGSNAGAASTTFDVAATGSATGDLNVNVPVINSGTNASGLIKISAGTMALNATNTYTGATVINGGTLTAGAAGALGGTPSIVVNAGGTLLLAQNAAASTDRINNAATVTLGASATANGGGKFNTGGFNEGPAGGASGSAAAIGALTLGNNSTIDFSTGATAAGSNLLFASLTYTAGDVVSIRDFTGASGSDSGAAGNDRLLFIANPNLSIAQLAAIKFFDDAGNQIGSGALEIVFNNYYEIVPVPEPATWLAGGLLVGLVGMSRRRQIAGWLGMARG